MFWNRRPQKAQVQFGLGNEEFYRIHNLAKTDYTVLRKLLTEPRTFGIYTPHTFAIHSNQAFRAASNELFCARDRSNRAPIHYSLQAHFSHLEETALNEFHRFLTCEAKSTEGQYNEGLQAIEKAFRDLEELNTEAWANETAQVDVVGSINTLLTSARSTVEGQRILI